MQKDILQAEPYSAADMQFTRETPGFELILNNDYSVNHISGGGCISVVKADDTNKTPLIIIGIRENKNAKSVIDDHSATARGVVLNCKHISIFVSSIVKVTYCKLEMERNGNASFLFADNSGSLFNSDDRFAYVCEFDAGTEPPADITEKFRNAVSAYSKHQGITGTKTNFAFHFKDKE